MANTRRPHPGEEQEAETTTTTHHTKKPASAANRLVTAAEYFLRLRNFSDTRTYALRARESDPTHPSPPCLLSIASVLSAPTLFPTRPDYYTLLNLARFESNPTRIKNSFTTLTSNLNPNTNKFPFSSEAFDLVVKAWAVLSDPVEKSWFDEELKRGFGKTFWTMCPYCYYVYEYDKVYQDCCLRCSNGRCGRGFHSVAIAVPPPVEVVEEGRYRCPGFVSFGGGNAEGLWVPFVATSPRVGSKDEVDCNGDGYIIDISDEETGVQEEKNGEKTKTGGEDENGFTGNVVNEVGMDWNASVNGNECLDSAIGGVTCESGIEFYEGKDDVLVGFQCDFDHLAD